MKCLPNSLCFHVTKADIHLSYEHAVFHIQAACLCTIIATWWEDKWVNDRPVRTGKFVLSTYTFKNNHCKIFHPFVWSIKNMQCTALKCNVITSVLTSCSNMEEKEFVSWLLWLRDYITGKNLILSSKPCHSWNPWQNQALIRSTDPMLWDDIRWAKMLTVNIFTFDCTLAGLHIQ